MPTAKRPTPVKPATTIRLKEAYNTSYKFELQKELGLANINQVPKLNKIVINIGLGKSKDDKKIIDAATNTLRKITSQQPIQTTAKKDISAFKLRKGNKVGLKVTLRDSRMYEFLDRLINLVIPRLRDFHGVNSNSFDKNGNFSLGLNDQAVFPELSFEETTTLHGLQIIMVINNANNIAAAKSLLEKFGMPFTKEGMD